LEARHAETKPEVIVIVIVEYADMPAVQKIAFLKSHPAMRTTPAVQQNRFVIMSYGDLVSGPRNIQGAEQLAHYLRSINR